MISQELFEEVYLSGDYEDAHSELAKRMGITRSEAKQKAYIHSFKQARRFFDCGGGDPYVWPYGSGHAADFECIPDAASPKEEVTKVGKKGDRVYQAPKAFWNKSK